MTYESLDTFDHISGVVKIFADKSLGFVQLL